MADKEKFLQYKGQPLVKCGNKIYYGDPSEKCILVLTILDSKKEEGKEPMPTRVLVQIQRTDPKLAIKDLIIKQSEKSSLTEALEIGTIWLQRELK